jgi:hypothetical protein
VRVRTPVVIGVDLAGGAVAATAVLRPLGPISCPPDAVRANLFTEGAPA